VLPSKRISVHRHVRVEPAGNDRLKAPVVARIGIQRAGRYRRLPNNEMRVRDMHVVGHCHIRQE